MYQIDGTTITIKQGDTMRVQISLVRDVDKVESLYEYQSGDRMRFIAKKKLGETQPVLIEKEVEINGSSGVLHLEPEDTKKIETRGKNIELVYDLEFTYANGDVDTPISNARFIIIPEVD